MNMSNNQNVDFILNEKYTKMPDFSGIKEGGTSILALNNSIQNIPKNIPRMTSQTSPVYTPTSHIPNIPNIPTTDHYSEESVSIIKNKKQKKIDKLVNDINKSLDDYSPSKSIMIDFDDDDDENIFIEKKKSSIPYIPDFAKELLLIVILYIILSQDFVYGMLSKYITYLNPNDNGKVPFIGITLYGLILAVLFIMFKKILF